MYNSIGWFVSWSTAHFWVQEAVRVDSGSNTFTNGLSSFRQGRRQVGLQALRQRLRQLLAVGPEGGSTAGMRPDVHAFSGPHLVAGEPRGLQLEPRMLSLARHCCICKLAQ